MKKGLTKNDLNPTVVIRIVLTAADGGIEIKELDKVGLSLKLGLKKLFL